MYQILIVEDNSDIALLYQRALFQYEHTVVTSARVAMQKLQEQQFDLVILDMHLPEGTGMEVLEFIRVDLENDDTRIVVISADDMLREECYSYDIQGWMTKPIEVDILMDMISRQLGPN